MADEVVLRGKIKVDAGKAFDELRDHLLVDLHLYATEIARVAVALGATALDVDHDADDVTLTFDGRLLEAEAIARARDHVLSPGGQEGEADALRLLGVGVSAALGLQPSFVDVYRFDDASCVRVRFEDGASKIAPAKRPEGVHGAGMRVHVRRRAGLETLGRAVTGEAPREVPLLVAATRDAPLVVRVKGESAETAARPVILAVPLDVPGATRVRLEISAPGATHETTFLERGVRLTSYPLLLGGWEEREGEPLPIRLLVDAPRLPTNASRSEVALDAPLVGRVAAQVPRALELAIETLVSLTFGRPSADSALVELLDPRAAEDALGAIASHVAAAKRRGLALLGKTELPAAALALLDLPLLRDAVGAPLAPSAIASEPVLVYSGSAPAPPELALWLGGIPWNRGRPADRCFTTLAQLPADDRVAMAREGHARRARAIAHPASQAVLPTSAAHVFKEAFSVSVGPFAGLRGEVAVAPRQGFGRAACARIFVEDRLLETVPLPAIALPVELALAWPGRFQARFAYDGVERGRDLERAILYALRVAAIGVGERLGAQDPELVRLAIEAWSSTSHALEPGPLSLRALGALAQVPAWPTTSETLVSLAALERYALRTGALCLGPPRGGAAPDGRPVLLATEDRRVRPLLPAATRFVHYTWALRAPREASRDALAREASSSLVSVPFERPDVTGFVGLGESVTRRYHAGRLQDHRERPSLFGPARVVFDDRALVPEPGADLGDSRVLPGEIVWGSTIDVAREEEALLVTVLDQCERGELDAEREVVHQYLDAAKHSARVRARAPEIVERLRKLPARLAEVKRERAKEALLARPARDPRELPGDGERVAVTGKGISATVALAPPGAACHTEVLYAGRPLGLVPLPQVQLVVSVDIDDDQLLDEAFAALSSAGAAAARGLIVRGAVELAERLSRRPDLPTNEAALGLVCALLEAHAAAASALIASLAEIAWPTIQGGSARLRDLGAPTPYGAQVYVPYREPSSADDASPYDAPALYVPRTPAGELMKKLMTALKREPVDVTADVTRLQTKRAHGPRVAPRLTGPAPATGLRASLRHLGATACEGEVELTDGLTEVVRVDGIGLAMEADAETLDAVRALGVPLRIAFRAETAAPSLVRQELRDAVELHVRRLAANLDEAPPFVRAAARAIVCTAVKEKRLRPGDDALEVFEDASGARYALRGLPPLVRVSRDPPPYPEHAPPVFLMSLAQAEALAGRVKLEDATQTLRRAAAAIARQTAPPLDEIALSPALRAQCIHTFPVDEDGIVGEIGLLAPSREAARGLAIHTTRRPLASIPDGIGWPTVAALDAEVVPCPSFDAIATPADVSRLQRAVHLATVSRAPTLFAAPDDALGVVRLPTPFVLRAAPAAGRADSPPRGDLRGAACAGVFWIDRAWPEAPHVHVEGSAMVYPFRVPRLGAGDGKYHRTLPVYGRLYVCAEGAELALVLERMYAWLKNHLVPLVRAAARSPRADPASIAAYEWDLALLGLGRDPVAELAGDRPDEALVRVASRRTPELLPLRAASSTGEGLWRAEEGARVRETERATPSEMPMDAASSSHEPTSEVPAEPDPASGPLLQGLVRRLVALVSPEARSAPGQRTPLTSELEAALRAMKLTGDPIGAVLEARRGRPVRFDAASKTVFVHAAHPSVKALPRDTRVVHLLLAALSEINRELLAVTDAEELAVVLDLLRERDAPSPT